MSNPYLNTIFDLTGRTALVTGASGGLGARFAQLLVSAGANVVIAARDRENTKLVELESRLKIPDRVLRVSIDVTDRASVVAALDEAVNRFGGVDVLVNNAGIADTAVAERVDDADWAAIIETNLSGAWTVAREFAQRLIADKRAGNITNITSILGQRVSNGLLPYAVSKAGLEQMTRSLSLEWARYNIRVNALAPGYIVTDMNRDFLTSDAAVPLIKKIPQRRVGEPADLDGSLLLLCSDASAFMTGSTLVVDGGHLNSSL